MIEKESTKLKPCPEIVERMPSSFRLWLDIEENAQAAVVEIMAAIDRGETTLADVLKERDIAGGGSHG